MEHVPSVCRMPLERARARHGSPIGATMRGATVLRCTSKTPKLGGIADPDRPVLSPCGNNGKGCDGNFHPSLKGRSARQTASTRVGELDIRYMRPFVTSLTDIHSYGTTVHMSILSSRFMRRVQIMPTSRLARSTGSRCHHAHPVDPCRAR